MLIAQKELFQAEKKRLSPAAASLIVALISAVVAGLTTYGTIRFSDNRLSEFQDKLKTSQAEVDTLRRQVQIFTATANLPQLQGELGDLAKAVQKLGNELEEKYLDHRKQPGNEAEIAAFGLPAARAAQALALKVLNELQNPSPTTAPVAR